jgi:DNA-binding CsgD family transcriptional regulator
MRQRWIGTVSLFLIALGGWAQTVVEGQSPEGYYGGVAYLDLLDSYGLINTLSDDMTLARAEVDLAGAYRFPDLTLSESPNFYRIRFLHRDDPEVMIRFGREHNVVCVLRRDDTLRLRGHELIRGPAVHAAVAEVVRGESRFSARYVSGLPERRVDLLTDERIAYLRGVVRDAAQDPYARTYALGLLGLDTDAAILRQGAAAFAETELPPEFRRELDIRLGGLDYRRLLLINRSLLVALIVAGMIIAWLGYRLRKGHSPAALAETLPPPVVDLSVKESEVLELLHDGKTNKEIAAELFVSVSTVKSHLNSIYRKLGVRSRREAVRLRDSTPV